MTAKIYDKAASTALRQITKYGMVMAVKRKALTIDPDKPWLDPVETTTSYPCQGIMTNFKSSEVDGQSILRTDKKVAVAAKGMTIVPGKTDFLSVSGTDYSIESVVIVAPAGDPIIYIIQARNV